MSKSIRLLPILLACLLSIGACARRGVAPAGSAAAPASSASTGPTAQSVGLASTAEPAPAVDPNWDHSGAKVPVTWNDPSWGRPDAPVTIVEFTDYQCPFCMRVRPTLERIQEKYGPGKVRLVTLNNPLPFHANAKPAAVAATAVFQLAGSRAFYQFTKLAFEHQRELSDASYELWAIACGVDREAFRRAVASERTQQKVSADMALAKQLGATGTPAFRINGVTVVGAQPIEIFEGVIDEQLSKAAQLVQAGTPAKDVYVVLTNRNFAATPPPEAQSGLPEEDMAVYRIPVLPDDPVLGPIDAPITIVEFSDFQCPFCKRAADTLKQVREHYGNDVRIIWKDQPLPFHPQALPAAILGRIVYTQKGNAAFWQMHDDIFAAQPNLEDKLEQVAKKLGISWATVKAAVARGRHKDRIDQDKALAADFSVRGTPHFFINGIRLSGAQPLEKFQSRIDTELDKARALRANGVQPGKIYEELTKIGKGPPEPERRNAPRPYANRPSRGPSNAAVVIQEWADFQCPFCKRAEATLKELLKEFPTQVRLAWRHYPLPFHPQAPLAAEAAEEAFAQAGTQGFWKFHDRLFEAQSEPDGLSESNLLKIARELSLDTNRFKLVFQSHEHAWKIKADSDLALSLDISGVPAFVINGYFLSGAQPIEEFRRLVKRALADTKTRPAELPSDADSALRAATPDTIAAPPDVKGPSHNARKTASGLAYVVLKKGTGQQHPQASSLVKVHYTGWTTDGRMFDSSVVRGQPAVFHANHLIKGWTEGLQLMVVGQKTRFWIPAKLAYGDAPTRPGAPSGTLVFDVELLDFE